MRRWLVLGGLLVLLICGVTLAALQNQPRGEGGKPDDNGGRKPVVIAAGDISDCEGKGDTATAKLVADMEGTVLALGDLAYERGSAEDFANCYGPTWGRFRDRTRPVPGNHEYDTEGAEAYFDYFGNAAGDPDTGYYSYELGSWHMIALNSNCEKVGGCAPKAPQVQWLEKDLAANKDKLCTLAYFHHARFSSGKHGDSGKVKPLWDALYEARADVVLSAHDHNYQRYTPQDPEGNAEPERGIRQFVAGSGGKSHYRIKEPLPNNTVYNDDTYGVLRLRLNPNGYEWRFVPVEGKEFTDSGSDECH
jgi:acid phosphatase type 7